MSKGPRLPVIPDHLGTRLRELFGMLKRSIISEVTESMSGQLTEALFEGLEAGPMTRLNIHGEAMR